MSVSRILDEGIAGEGKKPGLFTTSPQHRGGTWLLEAIKDRPLFMSERLSP